MTHEAALRWLTGLRNQGSRFGVERMRVLVERLKIPQRRVICFHVAGTNGKGSVCAMIEAIQRAHGRRTGLYTSPHLISIGERIQVDRVPLSDAAVAEYAMRLRPHYEAIYAEDPDLAPTFFELMTAAAWLEFQERKVDVVVLETGLGGRLDATNIFRSDVTVITSIGLDHQEYLGNTIASIAAEKAGILKRMVPVVLGDLPPEAESVIRAAAIKVGAPIYCVYDYCGADLPRTNLAGEHQIVNAGTALMASEMVDWLPMDIPKAEAALLNVQWEGRWQTCELKDGRNLIVDGSHNEEGAQIIDPLLAKLRSPTVIIGALGQSRALPLMEVAAKYAKRIIFVRPEHEKACTVEELSACVPASYKGSKEASSVAALFPSNGTCLAPGDTVVVLGSLYLAGEVLARLRGHKAPDGLQDRLPPAK